MQRHTHMRVHAYISMKRNQLTTHTTHKYKGIPSTHLSSILSQISQTHRQREREREIYIYIDIYIYIYICIFIYIQKMLVLLAFGRGRNRIITWQNYSCTGRR